MDGSPKTSLLTPPFIVYQCSCLLKKTLIAAARPGLAKSMPRVFTRIIISRDPKVIMTMKIINRCSVPLTRAQRKKIGNTMSNKNVKLPTLTLTYYVIIPFMKTMREKTIGSEHVFNGAIKRRSKYINY